MIHNGMGVKIETALGGEAAGAEGHRKKTRKADRLQACTLVPKVPRPATNSYDETQNTLTYANRAKNTQAKSVRNVYNADRHVKDYLKKIDEHMALCML